MAQELADILARLEAGEPLTEAALAQLAHFAQKEAGPRLKLALAHAWIEAGEERQALSLLERLRRDFPREASTWLTSARALLGVERYAEAEVFLEKARALTPADPEVLKVLAVLALRRGERARAMAWVEQVLSLDPFDGEARLLKEEMGAVSLQQLVQPGARAADEQGASSEEGGASDGARRAEVSTARASETGAATALPRRAAAEPLRLQGVAAPHSPGSAWRASVLARVLPVVRSRRFSEKAPLALQREAEAGLSVFYVLEHPEWLGYLPRLQVYARGLPLEEVERHAWQRLGQRLARPQCVQLEGGMLTAAERDTGLWGLAVGDGHDAARLLLEAQRRLMEAVAPGEPLCLHLGRRELVLFCRQRDAKSLRLLEDRSPSEEGIPGLFLLHQGQLRAWPEGAGG